jgi:hypothetical protein
MKHGLAVQVHVPWKLRQQRTLVLQGPTVRHLDVLQTVGATSAALS